MWSTSYSAKAACGPADVWQLFKDVNNWQRWNDGIERIQHRGEFKAGETFVMQPPGQEAFVSTLTEVVENQYFVDETRLGDVVVTVAHIIESHGDQGVTITYAVEVTGPEAEEIGQAVSSDFPDVLSKLVALAESQG